LSGRVEGMEGREGLRWRRVGGGRRKVENGDDFSSAFFAFKGCQLRL
jgi:hypothetical protein